MFILRSAETGFLCIPVGIQLRLDDYSNSLKHDSDFHQNREVEISPAAAGRGEVATEGTAS